MVELVKIKGASLTTAERNLFSVAFKNIIGPQRASWRTLSGQLSDLKKEEDDHKDDNNMKLFICKQYLQPLIFSSLNSNNCCSNFYARIYINYCSRFYR